MQPYYEFYVGDKLYLDFDSAKRVLSDFSIFPELISIGKIKIFFKYLVNKEVSEQKKIELIDLNGLVGLISLCALDIPFKDSQVSPLTKLISILQKISQSKGIKKVVLSMGKSKFSLKKENTDILTNFKLNFPHHFEIDDNGYNLGMGLQITNHQGKSFSLTNTNIIGSDKKYSNLGILTGEGFNDMIFNNN